MIYFESPHKSVASKYVQCCEKGVSVVNAAKNSVYCFFVKSYKCKIYKIYIIQSLIIIIINIYIYIILY